MDDIDEITYCKNEDCKYCYCFDEQSNSTDMKWHYYVEYKPQKWLFEGGEKGTHINVRTVQTVFNNSVKKVGIKKVGGMVFT